MSLSDLSIKDISALKDYATLELSKSNWFKRLFVSKALLTALDNFDKKNATAETIDAVYSAFFGSTGIFNWLGKKWLLGLTKFGDAIKTKELERKAKEPSAPTTNTATATAAVPPTKKIPAANTDARPPHWSPAIQRVAAPRAHDTKKPQATNTTTMPLEVILSKRDVELSSDDSTVTSPRLTTANMSSPDHRSPISKPGVLSASDRFAQTVINEGLALQGTSIPPQRKKTPTKSIESIPVTVDAAPLGSTATTSRLLPEGGINPSRMLQKVNLNRIQTGLIWLSTRSNVTATQPQSSPAKKTTEELDHNHAATDLSDATTAPSIAPR